MSLHVPHPHAPHPEFEEHPWRLLPVALGVIVLFAVLLTAASFALGDWFS